MDLQILQLWFTNKNLPDNLSLFGILNQQNEIIKLLKSKSCCSKNAKFSNAEEILHDGRKIWKYAKSEGLFLSKKPLSIGIWGQKSMYGKISILEKNRPKKGQFSMKYKEN